MSAADLMSSVPCTAEAKRSHNHRYIIRCLYFAGDVTELYNEKRTFGAEMVLRDWFCFHQSEKRLLCFVFLWFSVRTIINCCLDITIIRRIISKSEVKKTILDNSKWSSMYMCVHTHLYF